MDFQAVMQFIGTLGFPIAACYYHLYRREKNAERHKVVNNGAGHRVGQFTRPYEEIRVETEKNM